ncbi:MAG: C45 family peptidase [Polyangia bacterium]|jgi:hypothetical protein|nr:C45 family peptidase [Polyangia bacterium]
MRIQATALLATLALSSGILGGTGCEKKDDGPVTVDNGRLDQVDGVDVLWLWGTREEMGYAEGALLCGRIRDMFRDYVLDYVVPNSGYDYDLLTSMVAMGYSIPADDARELQAMVLGMQENCPAGDLIVESANLEAAAGGQRELEYNDLVIAHALADWACSSLTVWGEASATGSTLHARNLDFLLDPGGVILEQHLVKVYRSSEDGGVTWASVSFPGLIGCISCFNAEGTGITMHNVSGLDSENGAVPRMLAARAALVASVDATDTAVGAESALEVAPQQVGNNLHFSMACDGSDCTGGVVFEYDGLSTHTDGRVTVRAPDDVEDGITTSDAIACTNHYLERTAAPTSGNSYDRYQTLANGINAAVTTGGLDRAGALALMRTTADQGGSPTVHTVIMDTASMTLELYVPGEVNTEAPYTQPHVLDLNSLFSRFPE